MRGGDRLQKAKGIGQKSKVKRGIVMARAIVVIVALMFVGAGGAEGPGPLVRAHAHNDYEHKRPLFDALEQGFCSVEADVYLIEGRLLVAHNPLDLKPERSLQALYLEPLKRRVAENG